MIKALTEEIENDCRIVERYLLVSGGSPPDSMEYSAILGLVAQTRALSEQVRTLKAEYVHSLPDAEGSQ